MASQVLRKLCMLAGVLRRHHMRFHRALVAVGRGAFAILVVIVVGATIEVGRALVLVRTAVILVFRDQFAHVSRGVLV